jgi:hypothetical protein
MNEDIKQKFQIHYYFGDDSHTMNAFVRNKAEKDMLEAIQYIGSLCDAEVRLETEAYTEGGLKENIIITLVITGTTLNFLAPSINNVITHYFIKDAEDRELDKKIKQETLKSLELDNEKKQKELEKEVTSKLEDKQVARLISNFYTKINNYEKVQRIGFKDVEKYTEEYIVDRQYFKNFILEDNKEIVEDENATVEIISPILKEGKFKWKGLYHSEKIDFSMGDYGFKKDIIEGKHTFSNGSFIECKLQITITYDEFGDEKRRSYSVKEVFGIQELPQEQIKLTKSGKRKKKDEQQGSLFDFDEDDNDKS